MDSHLTDRGLAQARQQREILARCDLDGFAAFSSPQGRAFHTASIAMEGLFPRITTDPRLMEIGVGEWEGLARAELTLDRPVDESEESGLDLFEQAPGGEDFAALRRRCETFLNELEGLAVLVTHGVTTRMLRLVVTGRDTSEIGMMEGGQGIVFEVAKGTQRKLSIGA